MSDGEHARARVESAIAATLIAVKELSPGELIDVFDQVFDRAFSKSVPSVLNLEQLRLLRDVHAAVVTGKGVASEDLVIASRAVVTAHFGQGKSWDDLKNAIGNLADVLGAEA